MNSAFYDFFLPDSLYRRPCCGFPWELVLFRLWCGDIYLHSSIFVSQQFSGSAVPNTFFSVFCMGYGRLWTKMLCFSIFSGHVFEDQKSFNRSASASIRAILIPAVLDRGDLGHPLSLLGMLCAFPPRVGMSENSPRLEFPAAFLHQDRQRTFQLILRDWSVLSSCQEHCLSWERTRDHEHVCSVSETSLLVSRSLRNPKPPSPAPGHSLTMIRPPSTYSSPSAYLYFCQWVGDEDRQPGSYHRPMKVTVNIGQDGTNLMIPQNQLYCFFNSILSISKG